MQGALVMLMMALGFGLKSETPGLAERSTEGQVCPSHIKHHESLNWGQTHWVLSVTHSVTAHKGTLSPGARTARKAYIAFIFSHLDVGGKLSMFLTDPCALLFHQASKSKNSHWQ